MASVSTTPCCELQERMERYEAKFPLRNPATSGYGKKIQNMVIEHKRSHDLPEICHVIKRHDSAARITEPSLACKLLAAALTRMSPAAQQHFIRARKQYFIRRENLKMDQDIVRVQLVIEHCTQSTKDQSLRPGDTEASTTQIMRIPSRHAVVNATSFAEVCGLIREVYDSAFGASHQDHQHPSDQHGDITMELYLRYENNTPLDEANWRHSLELMTIMTTPLTGQPAGPICAGNSVARFTCGYSGESPKR